VIKGSRFPSLGSLRKAYLNPTFRTRHGSMALYGTFSRKYAPKPRICGSGRRRVERVAKREAGSS
jgi:hypothetical protein